MPGATAKGFPYPSAADPLGDGNVTIKALADFLNDRVGLIQKGNTTIGIVTVSVVASVAVVFATPFPVGVTPTVVATPRSTAAGTRQCTVSGATNTGFTLSGINTTNNADFDCQWIAIG